MGKALKWILISIGALIVLLIVALLTIPLFVDVQKYRPEIEERVSAAMGRPFSIKGDLSLSLFPWAGLSFSDLHLGNPEGFEEKDFLSVRSFDVRVKLLPLLSRDVRVKRFLMDGPHVVLIKNKDGRGNWEGLGKASGKSSLRPPAEETETPRGGKAEGLPIKALAVGEFAITNGSVLWIDHGKGERKEISDIALRLEDVSLNRPINIDLSARLDGKPLSLGGSIGPLGKEPGTGDLGLNLKLTAFDQLDMRLKGRITDPKDRQLFDIDMEISPFSPRKLTEALGRPFPVATTDPQALGQAALKAKITGSPKDIKITNGSMDLDQSRLKFSARLREFQRPDIAFDISLDRINLDRYLPPPVEKKIEEGETEPLGPGKRKTDYTPLRKLVLDGKIHIKELGVKTAKVQDIHMVVSGKNGVFRLDPFSAGLYGGELSSRGIFDLRTDVPKSDMTLKAEGIQVGPLIQSFLKKDILEGKARADIALTMEGDVPDRIKKSLSGKGDVLFQDGAIVGIDLAGMIRNIKAAFGLAEKGGEKPRTDFSELHTVFTINRGEVRTTDTRLVSPLLRVTAQGKAHLVDETLDFRVEPKFVASLLGQGDTGERAGITVPVLVTGSFASPKFRPDLKGMLKKTLEKGLPDPSKIKDMFKGGQGKKEETPPLEDTVKGLLKGLLNR